VGYALHRSKYRRPKRTSPPVKEGSPRNIHGVYNINRCREARIQPPRLGGLQKLVLLYAATQAQRFTVSDVVVHYGLRRWYGRDASKRVFDAVQRLVRRGYLRKIDRGWYELAVDLTPKDLDPYEEVLTEIYPRTSGASGGGYNVLRIHLRGVDSYSELLRVMYGVRCYLDVATRAVEKYLVERLGVSKYQLRRLRRLGRGCYATVEYVVVGAHGKYKCKSRPLAPATGGHFHELGVDIYVSQELGKVFAKVYTDRLPTNG
jgi:hypothetical protein